jgi:hypothetical protein
MMYGSAEFWLVTTLAVHQTMPHGRAEGHPLMRMPGRKERCHMDRHRVAEAAAVAVTSVEAQAGLVPSRHAGLTAVLRIPPGKGP